MNNLLLYKSTCEKTSHFMTKTYSTSFYWASMLFKPSIRQHIYNIYGFVRLADEIVDTFHDHDKAKLLNQLKDQYYHAIKEGISLNPILQSFVSTQHYAHIPQDLVEAFLHSMEMDLGEIKNLDDEKYREYIYGSAEVVGLMCLHVFVHNTTEDYEKLKPYAQSLGAAFQKINFLRDISADYNQLNRTYFPHVNFDNFTLEDKNTIEKDIAKDFAHALIGIKLLPVSSRFAVYMAYKYYINLFMKIKGTRPEVLLNTRIRVSNARKAYLYAQVAISQNLQSFA